MQRRILAQTMADPAFKTQLFRFVDVYPSIRDSGDLLRHLRDYLGGVDAPRPLDRLVATDKRRLPGWAVTRLTERGIQRMAETLIAGRDATDALPTLKRLRRRHTGFTLDLLGEACLSDAEAGEYARRYHDLLDYLPAKVARWGDDRIVDESPYGPDPRVNISLKVSSLYSQIDPLDFEGSRRAIVSALKPLFVKARQNGAFLTIDIERFVHRDLTYAAFADLCRDPELRDWPHLGIVVQAYLRDSAEIVQGLIYLAKDRGTPFTVRLVKGAYWDYETILAAQEHWPSPVFLRKAETDAQFEKLAKRLIDNWQWTRPALGTHNLRSIAVGIAAAEAAGLPPEAVEIQVLHGMADSIRRACVREKFRVREYVPVGELIPGMAYLVRRLLENTANESFLRHAFAQGDDVATLLAAPVVRPGDRAAATAADRRGRGDCSRRRRRPRGPPRSRTRPTRTSPGKRDREAMRKALITIAASAGRDYPVLIDGEAVQTGEWITSVNPAKPGEVVGRVAAASQAEADRALDSAVGAFHFWRDTPAAERADIMFKAAAAMRQQRFELSALEVLEAGKPWREADADVCEAIDFLEYYGREMLRLSEVRQISDVPGESDLFFYEPRGVAVVVAPWNFPLAIPTGMVSAALVAGNSVVFKPASPTPVLGYALVRILHEAGVPGGALAFLPGPAGEIGDYLTGDPRVDLIAFTGSLDVGTHIMEQAVAVKPGQRDIKRVIAEMGGKNAIIIDTDADLDAAVEGVLDLGLRLRRPEVLGLQPGDRDGHHLRPVPAPPHPGDGEPQDRRPRRPRHPRGPGDKRRRPRRHPAVHRDGQGRSHPGGAGDAASRRRRQSTRRRRDADRSPPRRDDAPKPDDIPAEGGGPVPPREAPAADAAPTADEIPAADEAPSHDEPGYFIPPHVFADVPPTATIAQEEIFGPVLSVIRATTFDEALQFALGVKYGLTGGLYSRNPAHIMRVAREFRVGNLYINRPITGAMVGRQPFGGSRMSGVGSKAGGPDYLLQFMEPRVVTENTIRKRIRAGRAGGEIGPGPSRRWRSRPPCARYRGGLVSGKLV